MINKTFKLGFFVGLVFIITTNLIAQQYEIDLSFESTYKIRQFHFPDDHGGVVNLVENEDGNIIIGGVIDDPTDNLNNRTLIKLSQTGEFDPSFYFWFWPSGIRNFYKYNEFIYIVDLFSIARIHLDTGDPDTSFYYNTLASNWGGVFSDIYTFINGDFLIAGLNSYHNQLPDERETYISRIKENGYYDTTFYHVPDLWVNSIIKYDDDRLMIGGFFNNYDSIPIRYVARIYNNGDLDTTFHSIFEGFRGPEPLFVQPDGKIIIGGLFNIENYNYLLGLVRLNPDGSLDSTFNNFNNAQSQFGFWTTIEDPGYDYMIKTICPTDEGKYLVGGNFPNYQGYERGRIALVDYNGYLDTTMFTGTGFDEYNNEVGISVTTIKPTSNNKYWVGGFFSSFNENEVEPIIRICGHTYNIEEYGKKIPNFNIYPNPASDILNIEFEIPPSVDLNIALYNINGSLITEEFQISGNTIYISVNDIKPGIYICQITSEDFVVSKKLVIVQD